MKVPVICQLCDFGPEVPGSFVDSMLYLAGHCRDELDIETFFFFPERAKKRNWLSRFDEQRFPYGFIPEKRNITFDAYKLLRNHHPLLFHTHFFQYDIAALLLKVLFHRHSKVLWHYHNPPGLSFRQTIKDAVKIRGFGFYVDRFIAVGDAVFAGLRNTGLPEHKVASIYNGIDVNRFRPDIASRLKMRITLGIPEDATVFLLLGWDYHRKGVDIFVKAAQETLGNQKNMPIFFIVGNEETKNQISAIFPKSSFHNAIRVIEPVEDFPSLLNGVDVFVSSSRSEGSPYAVLEAMAAKKTILSSNIRIPVVSGPHSRAAGVFVYPTEDWMSLSELMKKYQEMDPIQREALGLANWEYVNTNYSVEIWGQKIGEIYRSLLKCS